MWCFRLLLPVCAVLLLPTLAISNDGTIPLNARNVRIVAPAQEQELGELLASGLEQRTGVSIPVHPDERISREDWDRYHFLAIGRFSNNPVIERLYHEMFAYVDASFPGRGGIHVKTVPNPYRNGRNVIVIGGSDAAGTRESIEAFLDLIPEDAIAILPLHRIESDQLPSNAPNPARRAQLLEENKTAYIESRGSSTLNRASNYAMNFYFTNDEGWAELYRDTIMHFIGEARAHGKWYWAPRLALEFQIANLVESWKLIEDSPFFIAEERATIVQAFHDMAVDYLLEYDKFTEWANPNNEPRQNHTTFATISLDATARYFGRRGYDVSAWDAETERIFSGQLRTYRADDDAGHYSFYASTHTFGYYAKKNLDRVREGRMLFDLAELAVMITDNLRNEVAWGDVRTFIPFDEIAYQRHQGIPLGAAAWLHGDPGHQWAYEWMNEGKRIPVGTQGYANILSYRLDPNRDLEVPRRFLGLNAMLLNDAPLEWVAARVRDQRWSPLKGRSYFDKISLRQSFAPEDEYLLLDGLSALSHGHEDGNAVLHLTWKNRIWISALDYIRSTPRYKNTVEIIRDGQTDVVPPLSALRHRLESDDVVLLQTRIEDYNKTHWDRNILWERGRFFVVMDRIEALDSGDFDLRRHWRLLGDERLTDSGMIVTQPGAEFHVLSGDDSVKSMVREAPGQSEWERYPHAEPVMKVLRQRFDSYLPAGRSIVFADLMVALGEGEAGEYAIRRGDDFGWVVDVDGKPVVATGLARDGRTLDGLYVKAEIFRVSSDALYLSGATVASSPTGSLTASAPFNVMLQSGSAAIIEIPAEARVHVSGGFSLNRMAAEEGGIHQYRLEGFDERLLERALAIESARARPVTSARQAHGMSFGLVAREVVETGHTPTFFAVSGTGADAEYRLGFDNGDLLTMASLSGAASRLNVSHEVRWLVEEDGLLVAGDANAGISAFRDGERLWHEQLGMNRSRLEKIVRLGIIDTPRGRRLVVVTESARVHSYTLGGEKEWMKAFKYHAATDLAFADVDGDGWMELVIGNEYHTPINVYRHDGEMIWMAWEQVGGEFDSTTEFLGTHAHSLACASLNPGESVGIVLGNGTDEVVYLDASDGAVRWRANVGGEAWHVIPLEDGHVLVGTSTGYLHLIAADGVIQWSRKVSGQINGMDVARHLEIDAVIAVVGTEEGEVSVYDMAGNVLARDYESEPVRFAVFAVEGPSGILTASLSGRLREWKFNLPRSAYGPHYRTERHRY